MSDKIVYAIGPEELYPVFLLRAKNEGDQVLPEEEVFEDLPEDLKRRWTAHQIEHSKLQGEMKALWKERRCS